MDTYGDMVTLLLCFFVLLYSMSSISEEKWMALVRSFNPDAVKVATETPGGDGPDASEAQGNGRDNEERDLEAEQEKVDISMEELYQALKSYAAENDMGQGIEVIRGDGYVFVALNDAVFFAGDSYVLLPEGEQVLAAVSDMLSKASPYIDEVRVMGHTAQARSYEPNEPVADRFLSSNRATVAMLYIQEHSTISPARLVSMGYGQHRPADTNDTQVGKSHNRRVEFVITGKDLANELGDSVQQYYSMRNGKGQVAGSAAAGNSDAPQQGAPGEPEDPEPKDKE